RRGATGARRRSAVAAASTRRSSGVPAGAPAAGTRLPRAEPGSARAEARARRSSLAIAPGQEGGERRQPVALGRERHVRDAGRAQERADLAPLLPRRLRVLLAQDGIVGVDDDVATGLGIDEVQLTDVGKLLLPRVADLDRERRVAGRDPQQPAPPVDRAAEIGDDDDERALGGETADEVHRLAEAAFACRRLADRAEREQ